MIRAGKLLLTFFLIYTGAGQGLRLLPKSSEEEVSSTIRRCQFFNCGRKFICGEITCEASGYLTPGAYQIGRSYTDINNLKAYNLYKKIVNVKKYGNGSWHNNYPNVEDNCYKYYHLDLYPGGPGSLKVTFRNNACMENITRVVFKPYKKARVLTCGGYCPCVDETLFAEKEIVFDLELTIP